MTFHVVAPVYLCGLITKHEHATVVHAGLKIVSFSYPSYHVQPFFERLFLYAALALWNKLSFDIRTLEIDHGQN